MSENLYEIIGRQQAQIEELKERLQSLGEQAMNQSESLKDCEKCLSEWMFSTKAWESHSRKLNEALEKLVENVKRCCTCDRSRGLEDRACPTCNLLKLWLEDQDPGQA